jgi:hypothetical protein
MSIHNQEAVMGKAIPQQHPAVVLRSHFNFVRNLLAVAMVAVIGLSVAVVIVANDGDEVASTSAAQSAPAVTQQAQPLPNATRYDGGPEEGTRGMTQQRSVPAPGTRYDGGPDEGTRGITPAVPAPGTRYDGGPEEGSRGITPAEPPATRYDGGPEEGTRGLGFRTN